MMLNKSIGHNKARSDDTPTQHDQAVAYVELDPIFNTPVPYEDGI